MIKIEIINDNLIQTPADDNNSLQTLYNFQVKITIDKKYIITTPNLYMKVYGVQQIEIYTDKDYEGSTLNQQGYSKELISKIEQEAIDKIINNQIKEK